MTSYLLLMVKKPIEALEFISISERIALRMLQYNQNLENIDENNNEITEKVKKIEEKTSKITGLLLSNYILSINLMKSIALKCTNPDNFE